jgi:hypothetical protein
VEAFSGYWHLSTAHMDKTTRIGAPWTKEEEDTILAQVASGLHIAEIAVAQKRTSGGIRARLTRIACQLVEQKMSVFEASGRTGIRAARIQEALKRKTEQVAAKAACLKPKMEFKFAQTTSREELLGLPLKQKLACLQNIAEQQSPAIQGHAACGETSYLWEMDEPKLAQYLAQRGMGQSKITLQEVMEALRARYPGCKVELTEEWVDQIGLGKFKGHPPTRILKSGIKIDWS